MSFISSHTPEGNHCVVDTLCHRNPPFCNVNMADSALLWLLSTACISPACIVLTWILPGGLCYYKVGVFQVHYIWIELCKMYPAWWFWTLGMFRPVKFSLQAVLKCGILLLIFMLPICSLLTFPFVILHCFMVVLVLFCVCLTYYNLFLFYQIPLHSLRILEYYSSIVFYPFCIWDYCSHMFLL